MQNALASLPEPNPRIPSTLIPFLAEVSDGDARQALNSLELALSVCKRREGENKFDKNSVEPVSSASDGSVSESAADRDLMEAIKRGLRKGYDRSGEDRYDLISAMHKSIRGSDGSAALYWLARCVGNIIRRTTQLIHRLAGCSKGARIRCMLPAGLLWLPVKMLAWRILMGFHWSVQCHFRARLDR